MSKVHLSSSSVLGTLTSSPRTIPLIRRDTPPHSRVCRSLFGPVDHEELNREMKAKLCEIAERDQRRWNFNFGAGVPLLGDYEWEEAPGEASPGFYQECVRMGRNKAVEVSAESARLPVRPDSEHIDGVNCKEQRVSRAKISVSGGSGKVSCRTVTRKRPSPLTATRITDFYAKRRNTVGETRPESSSRKPFPPVAEEQTPRKRIR